MKKIIFSLMFCVVAISSVYALDEALVAKVNEMNQKTHQLLNSNVNLAIMTGQGEQIARKFSKQCLNKKWEYCGAAYVVIETDLKTTPRGKAYADKKNKQIKLGHFVCDELPDNMYSAFLDAMLTLSHVSYNVDKNYEKRDQCLKNIVVIG